MGTFSCPVNVRAADGSRSATVDGIGEVRVMVEGVEVTTIVIFAGEGAPALLGAYTLEGALLAVARMLSGGSASSPGCGIPVPPRRRTVTCH